VTQVDDTQEAGTEQPDAPDVEEPDGAEAEADGSDEADNGDEEDGSATGTSGRIQLPDSIISPIQALNYLKRKGLAAKDLAPQRMYGYVKNPGKTDPFPVLHYDAEGTSYKEPQVDEGGHTYTRPGVRLKLVVQWWSRADDRQKQRDEKKAAAAKAKEQKTTKAKALDDADLDAMLEEDISDEEAGEFVGAEEAE
jgi:hypothetical protein